MTCFLLHDKQLCWCHYEFVVVMTYLWRHDEHFDVMTCSWRHGISFDIHNMFVTSWTFWHHMFLINFLISWRIFDVITNLLTSWRTFWHILTSWRVFYVMTCFWRNDKLLDIIFLMTWCFWRNAKFCLALWSIFDAMTLFEVMTCFWHHDELFNVKMRFWRHDEIFDTCFWLHDDFFNVMLCFWRHDIPFDIIISLRLYDDLFVFLRSWRTFDVMTYLGYIFNIVFFTWQTFWRTDMSVTSWQTFWCHDVLLTSWQTPWHHIFYDMTNIFDGMTNCFTSWRVSLFHDKLFDVRTCFWLHDKLYLMSWHDELFDPMTNFFDVRTKLVGVMTYYWHHEKILTKLFLSWRMFWYKEKFLTSQHIFCIVWCCDMLLDLMKVTNLINARTS